MRTLTLKSDSHLPKNILFVFVLFYLNFCLNFLVTQKKRLDQKDKTSFIIYDTTWSQPGKKTIAIHIFSNISQSKDNQILKFGQLIKYNKRNIFLRHSYRNLGRKTSSKHFLFFKEALYEVKASDLQLSFDIFRQPSTWHTTKTNCIKLLLIQRYAQLRYFRKGSGNSFSTTFCV